MRRVAAPLAAVLAAALTLGGCGGNGAEPGAPQGATLVLDFTPNAAHSGIYAALAEGLYGRQGVDLVVREPGASTDAPKLLAAGRAEFAILDIHDLGLARERGLDLVGVGAIVQRPLASVIARAGSGIRRPRDLEGRNVGVTGLPSDDAVLDSVIEGDGGVPARAKRVTIGFKAVASLAAGAVDAATGFWNAEAVALKGSGVPVHVFRVDRYGAPAYPELVLCVSRETLERKPGLVDAVLEATGDGYRAVLADPGRGLDALLAAVPELDAGEQRAQLAALLPALRPPLRLDPAALRAWARWDARHGILSRPPDVHRAFALR
jgi:NitT/TauT family transport system substrate-binding protein/putative hydroxymethylpyrimidine transport system substrate-binding protein